MTELTKFPGNNCKQFNMQARIEQFTNQAGIADTGFCNLKKLSTFSEEGKVLCRGYVSAISVVVPLSRGILSEIKEEPTITYFAHYRAVNRLIDETTLQICLLLEKEGYKAYPVPASQSDPKDEYAGVFPHKTAAVLSGLGWIGKNALFVHSQYGPAVRLGTVLTNMPVEDKYIMESQCGDCTLCRDYCPAMAIEGREWSPGIDRKFLIDVRACSHHMKEAYQHIGRGSVCGLCITHCPYSNLCNESVEREKTVLL